MREECTLLAADRVERCGHSKDFGHATRSVGNRELRQPRTRADGEARHGEQPEPLRAGANTRLRSGRLSVTVALVMGTDPVDLAAPTIRVLTGATCRANVLASA